MYGCGESCGACCVTEETKPLSTKANNDAHDGSGRDPEAKESDILAREPYASAPGTVFPEAGGWSDAEDAAREGAGAQQIVNAHSNGVTLPKRERHGDFYDSEYDRGKVKKIKLKGEGGTSRRPNRPRPGAFQDAANRKG